MKQVPARRILTLQNKEAINGYLYIMPWIIGFLIFTVGPMIASLYFSFTDYNIFEAPRWVGLKNYVDLVSDPQFIQSLKVTLSFAVITLPTSLVLSLFLAILLNQRIPAVRFFRTLYFLPSVLSGVAVTLLWVLIFNPRVGALNAVLDAVGIKGPGWLTDPNWALISLAIISIWGIGQTMIIYLAGLQGVPTNLYDASKIDGAGIWQRFRYVTLPMISPVILYNLVLGLIGTFQYFTQAYVASGAATSEVGGPLRSTLFYNLYLYQAGFKFFEMGYASAMAWILFIIVLVMTLLVFKSSPMWVHYESQREGGM